MNVKNGGNCYVFKVLDSSFSLKQTEKKETRVETQGSLFKTELLKTLKLKKRRKEEEEEEEEEGGGGGGGGETHCADSSQRLSRFRDRIKTLAKLLNCNLR